jgi:tetratricopeptide (TPR) repeat protein
LRRGDFIAPGETVPADSTIQNAFKIAETGNFEETKRICADLIQANPNDAEALHLYSVAAYQTGLDAEAALDLIDRALAADPANGRFLNSQGALYYALGMNAEAEAAFRRSTELTPKDGTSWNNLGNTLLRLDRLQEAEQCFRQALAVMPSFVNAINNLGVAFKRQGILDKALICFREAMLQHPDYLDAQFNLAELHLQLNDLAAAETHFRKATEIDPNFAPAYSALAHTLSEQRRSEEALAVMRAAVERLPEDEELQFALRLQMSGMIPAWHIPMINDEERNVAYERALKRAVKPGDVVLEIGTGSGLVAMMSARAGAKLVVTCEAVPILAQVAKETVARNGYSGKVRVVSKRSTQMILGEDLPERADIFVSELINVGMLAPNMLPIIQHARINLCKPNPRIIPESALVWGALIECDHLANINPVRKVAGFDMSAFDIFRTPGYSQIDLAADPHRMLSERFRALDFDFRVAMKDADIRALSVTATETGTCHGIAFWFDLVLDSETVYRSESRNRTNHWKQAVHFFPDPVRVTPGDRLDIAAGYDATRIFFNLLRAPSR